MPTMVNHRPAYYSLSISRSGSIELKQRYRRFAWARRTARQIALDGGHGTMVTIYSRDSFGFVVPRSEMVNYFNVRGAVRTVRVKAR